MDKSADDGTLYESDRDIITRPLNLDYTQQYML